MTLFEGQVWDKKAPLPLVGKTAKSLSMVDLIGGQSIKSSAVCLSAHVVFMIFMRSPNPIKP